MKIYVSNDEGWYDTNTIAIELISIAEDVGLFLGTKNGKLDEEVCVYDEFKIREQATVEDDK